MKIERLDDAAELLSHGYDVGRVRISLDAVHHDHGPDAFLELLRLAKTIEINMQTLTKSLNVLRRSAHLRRMRCVAASNADGFLRKLSGAPIDGVRSTIV